MKKNLFMYKMNLLVPKMNIHCTKTAKPLIVRG